MFYAVANDFVGTSYHSSLQAYNIHNAKTSVPKLDCSHCMNFSHTLKRCVPTVQNSVCMWRPVYFFSSLTPSSTEPRDFRWSPIVVRLVPIVSRCIIASSGLFQIFHFRPHFPNFCQNLLVAVNRFLRLINFA